MYLKIFYQEMKNLICLISKRQLLLLSLTLFFNITNLFCQRGDLEDYEEYDWGRFKASNFIFAACICAIIISIGLYIQKNAKSKLSETVGKTIIWIGGIGALGSLGGPVLGAIEVLWKVGVGLAIFIGLLYWINKEFIDKK
jgi:hypothetical protein